MTRSSLAANARPDPRIAGAAIAIAHEPGDRAEIDDRAAARLAHPRPHRLGGEELMAQVHLHALVPVTDGDIIAAVAVVIAGIVDEDTDGPVLAAGFADRLTQA